MVGIHEDNFVVLVDTILVYPVGIKHTQVSASSANTLFSSAPQTTLELEVVDTLADGFTVGGTYGLLRYVVGRVDRIDAPLGTGFLRLPLRTRIR